jgi:hypothetical protein
VFPSPRLLVEGQKNGTLVLKAQGVGGLKEATAGFADELVRKENLMGVLQPLFSLPRF